ncbi:ankyrin repeat domain-containing protein [Bacteroidetes bacterium endosymbiont of Geopemphigus sp.]|uniref:ankyrin repeat domain-containing protein n=1 Tax=Bacteroidetes bacterium endosymbiont of Geopemphigus sp. TaxID=2047937 RepID=UPI003D2F6C67
MNRNTEATKELIEKGEYISTKNKYGYTPLHVEAYRNDKEIVNVLISKDANKKTEDKNGKIPYNLVSDPELKKFPDP